MQERSMATFEEAILYIRDGGRARRAVWATVSDYTRETPPLNYQRRWHIWMDDGGSIINGWGGSIGGAPEDDPIRDGTLYSATNADRTASDWELIR
jgi:hypothetical protein